MQPADTLPFIMNRLRAVFVMGAFRCSKKAAPPGGRIFQFRFSQIVLMKWIRVFAASRTALASERLQHCLHS